MPHAIWTQVAESDLDDILFYISFIDRKPETGDRIYYEIRDRVREHVEKGIAGAPTRERSRRMVLHSLQEVADFLSASSCWN